LTGEGRPKIGSSEISWFSVDKEGKLEFAAWGKFEEHYGNIWDFWNFWWKSSKLGICGWRKISRIFSRKRRGQSCGAAGSLCFPNWKLEDEENMAGTIWGKIN
jgi:hypothetical protein